MKKKSKYLIAISGPTAIGKTALSIRFAKKLNTIILSADSRQVYKELTIGTAKPTEAELNLVPHFFINHVSIQENYNVGIYEKEVIQFLKNHFKDNDIAIMCGGTGLYIDAVCNGLDVFPEIGEAAKLKVKSIEIQGLQVLQETLFAVDPEYYHQIDISNARRMSRALEVYYETDKPFSTFLSKETQKKEREFKVIKICLRLSREELYQRINQRVDEMIKNGLLDEVRNLLPDKGLKALETVGYKDLFGFLNKEYSLAFAIEKIKQHTRNYAKRQITWFKKDNSYQFFEVGDEEKILKFIEKEIHV